MRPIKLTPVQPETRFGVQNYLEIILGGGVGALMALWILEPKNGIFSVRSQKRATTWLLCELRGTKDKQNIPFPDKWDFYLG